MQKIPRHWSRFKDILNLASNFGESPQERDAGQFLAAPLLCPEVLMRAIP